MPNLIRALDARDRQAFDRHLSDHQAAQRAWNYCSTITLTGRESRIDDSHVPDDEYVTTLTGSRDDDPTKLQSCTLWVYWNYQLGWIADAVPFAVTVPTTSVTLSLAHANSDNREHSLIATIVSAFDKRDWIRYLNLFNHDSYSGYAWDACSVISPKNRSIDVVGSNGRNEIFVTMAGVNRKHPDRPQACTFWLHPDSDDVWDIDGLNGALIRTPGTAPN